LDTSVSLLERLRRRPDEPSWRRLDGLYRPLIERWLRLDDSLGHEREDLIQEVMHVIVREICTFERERTGSFRRWLRLVTLNRLKDFWRRRQKHLKTAGGLQDSVLAQLEDPASELSQRWDREHAKYVLTRLIELIEPEFESTTWKAFRGVVMESRKPLDVATDLGISTNAVLLAKSRILKRLREESKGLLDYEAVSDFQSQLARGTRLHEANRHSKKFFCR
jgi:RNA polymerase sigma-70 factor, ECF subfamily